MPKHYFDPRLKIFALNSNRPLAEKIATAVGAKLGKSSVTQFSDGEIRVNIEEDIHGSHIYVIQSTSSPVNDDLMGLLIMIDALKRASTKAINVVMPYYGYARQDRKACAREPITAELVTSMIQKTGATRMLALDLHIVQIQDFLNIPVDHLMGTPPITSYFLERGIKGDDIVTVSPDHGDVTRTRKLAEPLKSPVAIIDKRRSKINVAEVINIVGQVRGRTCVLVGGMIDTASTITLAADALKEAGAASAHTSCTHPVSSGPALQRIEDSAIERLVVTDSIYLPENHRIDKIGEVGVGELMGNAIKRIRKNKPIDPLFEIKNK